MKITVRLPTETYAYVEVEFGSLEEYASEYPKFAETMAKTRLQAKNRAITYEEEPFKGNEFNKRKKI